MKQLSARLAAALAAAAMLSASAFPVAAGWDDDHVRLGEGYDGTFSYVAVTDGTVYEESYPDCYPWIYASMYNWTGWTANEGSVDMDSFENAYVLEGVGTIAQARAWMIAHPELEQMYYLDYTQYSYGCWDYSYAVEIPVYDVIEGQEDQLPNIADIPELSGYTLTDREDVGQVLEPDSATWGTLYDDLYDMTDKEQLAWAEDFAQNLMEQYPEYFGSITPIVVPMDDAQESFYTAHSIWEGAGDLDGDGKAGILDVITLSKALMGAAVLDEAGGLAADLNGSGAPDQADALMLLQHLVGVAELPLS